MVSETKEHQNLVSFGLLETENHLLERFVHGLGRNTVTQVLFNI